MYRSYLPKALTLVAALQFVLLASCNFDPGAADSQSPDEDTTDAEQTDAASDTGTDDGDADREDTGDDEGDTDISDTSDAGDAGGDTTEDTAGDTSLDGGDTSNDADGTTTDGGDTQGGDTTGDTSTDTGPNDTGPSDTGPSDTGPADTAVDSGAVCGNNVKEPGEECDDGNQNTGDGCTANCKLPTAFRIESASLVDPEIKAQVGALCSCNNVTFFANQQLQTQIDNYDANFVQTFRPLDLTASTNRSDFYPAASCNADSNGDGVDECSPGTSVSFQASATNEVGSGATCFSAQSSRTTASHTNPNSPSDPCYSTQSQNVTVNLLGCSIELTDTTIAAEYSSTSDPTALSNGVIRGFVSESEARTCTVQNSLLCKRDEPDGSTRFPNLYEILDKSNDGCGLAGDKDTNGGTPGWWFYINVSTASEVTWTE